MSCTSLISSAAPHDNSGRLLAALVLITRAKAKLFLKERNPGLIITGEPAAFETHQRSGSRMPPKLIQGNPRGHRMLLLVGVIGNTATILMDYVSLLRLLVLTWHSYVVVSGRGVGGQAATILGGPL